MTLKICLSGATGHVGQELIKGILNSSDLELVSCLGFSTAGKRLQEVVGFPFLNVPGFYSTVETVFGLPGERGSIKHDSISYIPYVEGTLMAAKKVVTMKGLVRGMNDLLGLPTDLQ